jgi:hypothetical protein
MRSWGYVALCLLLPVIWGILSARIFDWIHAHARGRNSSEARVGSPAPHDDAEMYYI